MARVGDRVDVVDDLIARWTAWYNERPAPESFATIHPKVIATAKRLCGGDWRYCTTDDGESIIVHNKPVW